MSQQRNHNLNQHWNCLMFSYLCFPTELAQLSGIAAMLRFPMPELEDEDDTDNETQDSDSDN